MAGVHEHPTSGDTVTQTAIANSLNNRGEKDATFEFDRFVLCDHPYVLECYGKTKSDDGSWLLLLEHAANGDVESFYKNIGFEVD